MSQVLSLCTVSVARQRRRVMGITMKRATIKSCMHYVTKNSMIFFLQGTTGEQFSWELPSNSQGDNKEDGNDGFFLARSLYLGVVLFLVLLLPLDFFEFFLEVAVAAEKE